MHTNQTLLRHKVCYEKMMEDVEPVSLNRGMDEFFVSVLILLNLRPTSAETEAPSEKWRELSTKTSM